MSRKPPTARLIRARLSGRGRDIAVVSAIALAIFALLSISGALGWVEAVTAAIVLTAAAMAYFVGSSATDVEEDEIAQATDDVSGKSGEMYLPALLESLPLPALHIDGDSRIVGANAPARNLFRVQPSQRNLAATVIRNPALLGGLDRALASPGRPERVELPLVAGGESQWLAHIAPLKNSGDGALILLEDHTALRRAEQARADFLANASHELRTPLTSLAGFIETMRGPAREDKAAWDRYLEIMFDQTERMKRLIADLLSLSRIEFSEHRAPEQVEDVAGIFTLAIAALRPVAEDGQVKLSCDGISNGLPAIVEADEMAQVVQNLVANAVKYSKAGQTVEVKWGWSPTMEEAQSRAGRQWRDVGRMTILPAITRRASPAIWLRVGDSGPGIERQHLPRLGQRFYRVDESRGGHVIGTGLGLAIVKHILARHRGGVMVESEPGRGSAFGVWFPANWDASQDVPPEEPGTAAASQTQTPDIAGASNRA